MTQLLDRARAVLENNWTDGTYTRAAKDSPGVQNSWVSAFSSMGNAHFAPDRSAHELRELFEQQWPNGLLPLFSRLGESPSSDPLFLDESGTGETGTLSLVGPPLQAVAAWHHYRVSKDKSAAAELLSELYPKLVSFHRYLYSRRDPAGEYLISIFHPWESGMASSPVWREVLQLPVHSPMATLSSGEIEEEAPPLHQSYRKLASELSQMQFDEESMLAESSFLVQDPFFNAMLCWSNECLIHIGGLLKKDLVEVLEWHENSLYSMNEKLWDEEQGLFSAWNMRTDEGLAAPVIGSLLPMAAEVPIQDQAEEMLNLIESVFPFEEESDRYMLPSALVDRKEGEPMPPWDGPVWIHANYLMYIGLHRFDMFDMAERLREETLQMVEQLGFFQYADPRKDSPRSLGAGDYSVAAALVIDLLTGTSFAE
ncbi:MAG: trehalase family glycosidase [Saprospiraceae bacterium]|nr:trehalase family glycosidase [Saprospiraceae bacterium]